MPQENECASLERHEHDIRDLRRDQENIKIDVSVQRSNHDSLERIVLGLAEKVEKFIVFCQDREEKREEMDSIKDKEMLERFAAIEGKIIGSSMVFKIANNAITIIITGIIMLLVVRALPELSTFLH